MLGKIAKGLWGVASGDPFWRYRLAEIVSGCLSRDSMPSEYGRRWPRDEEFQKAMKPFEGRASARSLDRKWMLRELLKLVQKVEGDTAECGTWRGGSSWLIAKGLGRPHHAFDSFEGLSQPDPKDGAHFRKGDLAISEEEFRARLADVPNLHVYKGWIPTRFPEVGDRRFSFVHVDVDLYQPTRDAIEFFYPRLNPGGILLLDDYGFFICPGARQAADEFFKDRPEPILEVPTGQGLVVRSL
jgi:hypothetical protein